jgi:hypothetical protein
MRLEATPKAAHRLNGHSRLGTYTIIDRRDGGIDFYESIAKVAIVFIALKGAVKFTVDRTGCQNSVDT